MKNFLAVVLAVTIAIPAMALVEGSQVAYVGGTAAGIEAGVVGKLDLTSSTDLVYTTGTTRLAIPYASITSFYYSEVNMHRLGVLATIGAGLVAARMKRHLYYISYKDASGGTQSVTLEVARDAVGATKMAIEARIPKGACKPRCVRPWERTE